MKTNILYILFIVLNLISLNNSQSILIGNGDITQFGLIGLDDEIGLNQAGGIVTVNQAISFKSLTVGFNVSTDKNITLDVFYSMVVSDYININDNNTMNLNIQGAGTGIVSDEIKCPLITLKFPTSILNNFGSVSGKSTNIEIDGGLVDNQGILNLRQITNSGGIFKSKENTRTTLSSLISTDGYTYLQGELSFSSGDPLNEIKLQSQSDTTFNEAWVTSNLQNIKITQSSGFELYKSTFTCNRIDYLDDNQGSISTENTSTFKITDRSQLDLYNVTFSLKNSTSLNVTGSSMFSTDSIIRLSSDSETNIIDDSYLISSAPFLVKDNSKVSISESSFVESKSFFLTETSSVKVDNSNLTVGYSSNERPGSSSSSSPDDEDNSTVPLKGRNFIGLAQQSTLSVSNSSSLNIQGIFGIINDTTVLVNLSSVYVGKSFHSFDSSDLTSINSTFEINDSFNINDKSTFSFTDSTIDISGSFEVLSKNINLKREFVSSDVKVDGKFFNIGSLSLNKSNFDLNKNFTSAGIVNSLSSNILVRQGEFNILGLYDGIDDEINLTNGQMQIGPLSNFKCKGCLINSNGEVRQAKRSIFKLIDSTFNNNGKGEVEISGDITLDTTSKLFNSGTGKFILQASINSGIANDAHVENNGTFIISDNGNNNDTEVNVKFENRGSLSVSQNSLFNKLNQYTGSLNLLGNVNISSINTMDFNGGSIYGNGILNASVNNSAGTLGNNNIGSLEIVGNYTQDEGATIIITINSMTDFSKIKFSSIANVNGGKLIVRMNEDMVSDSSNYNQSMSFMTSNSEMSGNFSQIQFKTYNKDGEDTDVNDNCKYNMQQTSSSYSLLLSDSCEQETVGDSGLTTPQIIGIAIGGFGFVVVAAMIGCYVVFQKYRYSENSIKLKKWVSKFRI